MLGPERMNSGGQVAKACKDGGPRAGPALFIPSFLESTGVMGWWKERGLWSQYCFKSWPRHLPYLSTGGNNVTFTPQNGGED